MLSAAEDGEVAGGVNSPPTPTKKPKRKGSRREKERMAVVPAAVGTDATPAGALLHLPASHTDARDEKLEEAKAKKEKKSAAAHKRQKSKGGGGGSNLCTTSTSSAVLPIQSNTSSAPALHVCRREKLVEELLSSERAHVHNLNAFLHDYVIPLRDKKILSTDELQGILCNLELIRRWNVEFLNQLESALEDERGFGELFLEMLPMLRQLYAQYNENYAHAMDHYEKCKKNKEFAAFIESVSVKHVVKPLAGEEFNVVPSPSKNFLSFLYLPIQRILAYYSLLKDLVCETPQDHPEYEALHAALQQVNAAVDHADKLANQRKNIDKVISIQSQLIGDYNTSLAQPHRRFVYQGDVFSLVGKAQKERRLFLFNDVLLCTKKKHKNNLKVDFLEPLEMLRVEEPEELRDRYTFRLFAAAKEYTLWSADKAYWMQLIATSIQSIKASRPSLPFLADIEQRSSKPSESHGKGSEEEEREEGQQAGLASASSSCSDEETLRERLIQRIIAWSKMEDDSALLSEVRRFGTRLEKTNTNSEIGRAHV